VEGRTVNVGLKLVASLEIGTTFENHLIRLSWTALHCTALTSVYNHHINKTKHSELNRNNPIKQMAAIIALVYLLNLLYSVGSSIFLLTIPIVIPCFESCLSLPHRAKYERLSLKQLFQSSRTKDPHYCLQSTL